MLKVLYRSKPLPVDRQKLLHEVWGYTPDTSTHTLETHIYRLRQKMEPNPACPVILLSTQGGYLLSAEPVFAATP